MHVKTMAATENIILFISSSWRFSNNLFIQHKSDWAKTITINFFFEHTMVNHVLHNEKLMEFHFHNLMPWKHLT